MQGGRRQSPLRTPRSLKNGTGWKPRYAPGEEEEDLETRSSSLHLPDEGQEGEGPALEGLGTSLP